MARARRGDHTHGLRHPRRDQRCPGLRGLAGFDGNELQHFFSRVKNKAWLHFPENISLQLFVIVLGLELLNSPVERRSRKPIDIKSRVHQKMCALECSFISHFFERQPHGILAGSVEVCGTPENAKVKSMIYTFKSIVPMSST